jgi:ankyrin repeat protein
MQTPEEFTRRSMRRIGASLLVVLMGLVGLVAWKASVGQMLLLWSVEKEHFTIAHVLLGLGLDPNGDPKESSPLNYAKRCRPEFVRLLLQKGADPNRADFSHNTPLRGIPDWCQSADEIVDLLATAGADFLACPPYGGSLLTYGDVKIAALMLKHGADPNQSCSSSGQTPLHSQIERPEVVALLLDHGAKIVAGGSDQWTPLHAAANLGRKDYQSQVHGRLKSAELLLAHGADVNAVDKQGRTPLDLAYEHGDKEMADILIKHGGKAQKYDSLEAGEDARDGETEYRDLYSVAEGVRKGPACSLSMHGDNHAIMEEGPNWSIIQGTVGVVRVNCHASGYFHYAVVGMGSPVPKRLNMRLSSGIPGSERITFDKPWSNGVMHWYYSAEPIKNLVRAISRGDATHFAVRYVNVGN